MIVLFETDISRCFYSKVCLLYSSVCRSEPSCSVSGFLFRLWVWKEDQHVHICGPNIIYLSTLNNTATFYPHRYAWNHLKDHNNLCRSPRIDHWFRGNKYCNFISVFVIYSIFVRSLSQVVMRLNCFPVVPGLDRQGNQIFWDFFFLSPSRQMSG
jgi:hypothetical protein